MILVPLSTVPAPAVESLLDRAFGRDRQGRTAYRLRDGTHAIDALSFAAVDEQGRLMGTIQCWPIQHVAQNGQVVAMILVGPVAVEPAIQRGGIGQALMTHMLDATANADLPGTDALMLIGDPEYYGRFFGFSAAATGAWRLPGPFEAHRLLARGAGVPKGAGTIVPRG